MENQYQNQNQNQNFYSGKNLSTVSIGDWIVTFILMAIPLVNFIMLFVWAFGSNTPQSKANWAKATLILYVVAIVLLILFAIIFAGSMAAIFGGLGNLF